MKRFWPAGVALILALGLHFHMRGRARGEEERRRKAAEVQMQALRSGDRDAALAAFTFFDRARAEKADAPTYYPGYFLAAAAVGNWELGRAAFSVMPKEGDAWRAVAAQYHIVDAGQLLLEAELAYQAGEGERAVELRRRFTAVAAEVAALDPGAAVAFEAQPLAGARAATARILSQPAAYARYAEARFAWNRQVDAKKALRLLDQALLVVPSFVDARILQAVILLQEDKLQESAGAAWSAQKNLEGEPFTLVSMESALASAYALRATALHRRSARLEKGGRQDKKNAKGLAEEAKKELEKALAAEPENAHALALKKELETAGRRKR